MANYSEFLYDDIGNKYKRKNLYLLELSNLQTKLKESKDDEKKKIQAEIDKLVKHKNHHPYIIKLQEYRKNERTFLKALSEKEKGQKIGSNKYLNYRLKSLYRKLSIANEKRLFYKKYVELTYEAEFNFRKNNLITEELPKTIESLEKNIKELNQAIEAGKVKDKTIERNMKLELNNFKIEEKKRFLKDKDRIKSSRKAGLISRKAKVNGIKELKRKYKRNILVKSYESPLKSNNEKIKSLRYEIRSGTKRNINIIKANIADIRRRTPIETSKVAPIVAFTTFPLPGLGQILNKQYGKALIFFLVSIFTYLIAVPYALGYGNYQGEGILGLISLAQGGARVHKSLIFMIEGIIAIFLILIALILLYLSFRDVLKVERDKIKGIRHRNWFETMTSIKDEGFPYMVSFPALFVIIFIVIVPVTTTALLSLTSMNPQNQSKFGWILGENYKLIALGQGLAGSVFWLILFWTIVWTLVATTLAIFIGIGLALLANNSRVKGKGFFRTVYLLPWAVPAFITIMFFSIMFSPNGALTDILNNLFGARIEVKNDPLLTRIILILLQGWLGSAYVFLLTTGVLQAIPNDLYEAADIDGASSWQKTRRITLPMILFQISPLLVTQYTFNFNNFSIIYLFNGGGPFNPNKYGNLAGSSDLLISYIFKLTMENQYQAIGAAITIFISLGLMFFAYLGFRNSKGFKEGRL